MTETELRALERAISEHPEIQDYDHLKEVALEYETLLRIERELEERK